MTEPHPLEAGRGLPRLAWWLSAGLAAAAVCAGGLAIPIGAPVAPFHLSWPVLAAGFAAAEALSVTIPIAGRHHRIAALEIPLVVGLATIAPGAVAAARVSGGVLAAALRRRTSPRAALRAITAATVEVAAAAAVYHAVLGRSSPADPVGWTAALAAVTVAALVKCALGRTRGSTHSDVIRLGKSLLVSVGVGLAATIGVISLWADVNSIFMLIALLLGISATLWGFARLGRRHTDLTALFDFTRAVGTREALADSVTAILSEIRDQFGVETAALIVALDTPAEAEALSLVPGTAIVQQHHIPVIRFSAAVEAVGGDGDGTILDRPALAPVSAAAGVILRDGLATVLSREGRPGVLVIAGNRCSKRTFDRHDARLFGAIAEHATITLERQRLIQRLTAEIAERRRASLHDALTGLPNRDYFSARVGKVLATEQDRVAVLIIDLDHFKEVNDTLGHDQGDRLLREVSIRLASSVRPADVIARLGGDEFGVLITVGSVADAIGVARRVEEALRRPYLHDGIPIEIGASIGIALGDRDTTRAATMLQRADIAMYAAKRSSGVYEVYSDDLRDNSPERLALVGELRAAIDERKLEVSYQPLIELETGRTVGVEALARWRREDGDFVAPADFVPIAERTGLIRPLTAAVLRTSLKTAARWHREGHLLRVSVNLSRVVLHDVDFVTTVADLLRVTGVDPTMVTFEVTEGTVMHDARRSRGILERLHDLGTTIALDDFGTGYSTLAAVREFPIEEIKVDRSFVTAMDSDPGAAVIVGSTVTLAHQLGMRVVAEGVESERALEMLREMGCDLAQGFHVGRAMPAAAVMSWISARSEGTSKASITPLTEAPSARAARSQRR